MWRKLGENISNYRWYPRFVGETGGKDFIVAHASADPQALAVATFVNGEAVQRGTTRDQLFPVAELIEFLSRWITLEPGDVVSTGTPAGVGFFRQPPRFLKPGDTVEVEVERIGRLSNPVVAGW